MKLHRPEPVLNRAGAPVDRTMPPDEAADRLRRGEVLVVTDDYSTGAEILSRLPELHWRQRGMRLLAPIVDHQLALSGARPIGFLKELYPELSAFFLPFIQVQELHGAWVRYEEGVHLAVLGHRVHPFYETYVPNRTSHLELFGTWLSQYTGARGRAVDVGTGCGVLALMLCRAGFSSVLATDVNPNAIESVARELERLDPTPPIALFAGDLLGDDATPADLVVFNPPWLHRPVQRVLDAALYYDDALFERFFDQALGRLSLQGRIVVVFSNIGQLVQPEVPHPIEAELAKGRLQLVDKLRRKVAPAPGRRTRERVEVWELRRA